MMAKTIKNIKNIGSLGLLIAALFTFSGCIKTVQNVGYTFDEKEVESLEAGTTRKVSVEKRMGSPSAKSTYGDETWYYISTEYESIAFLKPKVKNQSVLAISFDNDETIKEIKRFSKDDIQNIKLSGDYTRTEGHDVGMLGQLLGNVGRFNTDRRDMSQPRGR